VQGPQPDTSGNCKIMDMGPVCHIVACLVIPGTNLYVLVTEVHGCHCVNCQLLAQRCYLIVTWLGIKLMTTWSGVPLPIVTPPSQCVCNNSTQLNSSLLKMVAGWLKEYRIQYIKTNQMINVNEI